jgi:hypothetical protein
MGMVPPSGTSLDFVTLAKSQARSEMWNLMKR